jgi:hypothetical protein
MLTAVCNGKVWYCEEKHPGLLLSTENISLSVYVPFSYIFFRWSWWAGSCNFGCIVLLFHPVQPFHHIPEFFFFCLKFTTPLFCSVLSENEFSSEFRLAFRPAACGPSWCSHSCVCCVCMMPSGNTAWLGLRSDRQTLLVVQMYFFIVLCPSVCLAASSITDVSKILTVVFVLGTHLLMYWSPNECLQCLQCLPQWSTESFTSLLPPTTNRCCEERLQHSVWKPGDQWGCLAVYWRM